MYKIRGKIHIASNRVLRGGSWNNNTNNLHSWNRNNNNPNNTNNNNGFRCSNTQVARICKRDFIEKAFLSPDFFLLARAKMLNRKPASNANESWFSKLKGNIKCSLTFGK